MKVRLSLLNEIRNQGWTIGHDELLRVAIAGQTYEIVGTCKVLMNAKGEYYGELKLDKEIDENLYFYYTNLISEHPAYWFEGLQLNVKPIPAKPTTQLKDMIIH